MAVIKGLAVERLAEDFFGYTPVFTDAPVQPVARTDTAVVVISFLNEEHNRRLSL